MNDEKWKSSFFLSVWFARMLVVLLAVHWGNIGSTVLIDVPMDWAAEYTSAVVALVGILSVAMIWFFRNKAGAVERRRRGPAELLKYSMLSLTFALVSGAAGIVLFLRGEYFAAFWMQALGVSVALFEVYGLVGSIVLGAVRSPNADGDDSSHAA